MQRVGLQLVQPEPPERDQQLVAAHASEAGQREPLERALEAPLGRPGRLADERLRLGARVQGPLAVGAQRLGSARGIVGGARPERDAVERGSRRPSVTPRRILEPLPRFVGRARTRVEHQADARERVLALQRRQVDGQEAHPGGALELAFARERADLVEQARRRRVQAQQTAAGEGDLLRQAGGVLEECRPGTSACS